MVFGKGYSTKLSQLQITVEVREMGWSYWISKNGKEITRHNPCWPWNQTDEKAKLEAVAKALELLEQPGDPASASAVLEWEPYGPGNEEVTPR